MSPEELYTLYDERELDVQRATVRTVVRTLRRLRDEDNALQKFYLREARKLPGWQTLNRTDKHVARHLTHLMTHSPDVFMNAQRLCTLIPPSPTSRRPNTSGHISRTTLWSSLKRLEAAGIFTSWKTLGKRLPDYDPRWRTQWSRNGRTPAIRVPRLAHTAWVRAWGTFKQTVRRNLNTVRAEASLGRRDRESGRLRSGKMPLWLRDNDSQARPYIAKVEQNERLRGSPRTWAIHGLTIEGVEFLFGERAATEYGDYLARGGPAAEYARAA